MSKVVEPKEQSFWAQLLNQLRALIGLPQKTDTPPAPPHSISLDPGVKLGGNGPGTKPTLAEDVLEEAIPFPRFIAVKLPAEAETLSEFSSDEARNSLARSFAQQVRKNLSAVGFDQYEFLELYLPADTAAILSKIYDTETRKRRFSDICGQEIFPAEGGFAQDKQAAKKQRVYVVHDPLLFHHAFDPLLRQRVIARPLGTGRVVVPVPTNPSQVDWQADQLLIGLLQISDEGGEIVKEAPIWAWRAIHDMNTILIDVDFDLMTRAFQPNLHYFPLGISIRCSLLQHNNDRLVHGVSMEIKEAKRWIDLLNRVGVGSQIVYQVRPGGDRNPQDLNQYHNDSIDVLPESDDKAEPFSLGSDENQRRRVVMINRHIGFTVSAYRGKSYTYYFGFFEHALNFVPAKNIMRITGQFVLRDAPTDVMLPSGALSGTVHRQEPVFRLTPDPTGAGRFKLKVLRTQLEVSLRNSPQPLGRDEEVTVEIGDSIEASSDVKTGGKTEKFKFTLRSLNLLPANVVNHNTARPYTAFVEVEPAEDRKFILFEKKHVFGRGHGFSEDAYGIGYEALKFSRPYVYLKVAGGEGEKVFYVNKADIPPQGGSQARLLTDDELQLDLNGSYEIYLGDFQITLNLKGTPGTSRV